MLWTLSFQQSFLFVIFLSCRFYKWVYPSSENWHTLQGNVQDRNRVGITRGNMRGAVWKEWPKCFRENLGFIQEAISNSNKKEKHDNFVASK